MKFSLREMLFWIAVSAIGLAAVHWTAYGAVGYVAGGFVVFLILILVLARLETLMPYPVWALTALFMLTVVLLFLLLPVLFPAVH